MQRIRQPPRSKSVNPDDHKKNTANGLGGRRREVRRSRSRHSRPAMVDSPLAPAMNAQRAATLTVITNPTTSQALLSPNTLQQLSEPYSPVHMVRRALSQPSSPRLGVSPDSVLLIPQSMSPLSSSPIHSRESSPIIKAKLVSHDRVTDITDAASPLEYLSHVALGKLVTDYVETDDEVLEDSLIKAGGSLFQQTAELHNKPLDERRLSILARSASDPPRFSKELHMPPKAESALANLFKKELPDLPPAAPSQQPLPTSTRQLVRLGMIRQVTSATQLTDVYLILFSDLLVVTVPVTSTAAESVTIRHPFHHHVVIPLSTARLIIPRDVFITDDPDVLPASIKKGVATFNVDAQLGVNDLLRDKVITQEPPSLAAFLHKTPGVSKKRISKFLAQPEQHDALVAYMDRVPMRGLELAEAFWVLIKLVQLPKRPVFYERWITVFANAWAQSNPSSGLTSKDVARILLHACGGHRDNHHSDTVDEIYKRLRVRRVEEEAEDAIQPSYQQHATHRPILCKRFPTRLTVRTTSDTVTIRLPKADPHLRIYIVGESGCKFDPQVLHFNTSNQATFTVSATKIGKRCVAFLKAGKNAGLYDSLGCRVVLVERVFMKWTFRIDTKIDKRRFMFSVNGPERKQAWCQSLESNVQKSRRHPLDVSELARRVAALGALEGRDLIKFILS